MNDEKNDDDDDGWQILKPGVVLFETTIWDLNKPIPHPVLDDPSKMMRIIANPLYDKLTLSRAASIRKLNSPEPIQELAQLNRSKERPTITLIKSSDTEQTLITSIPNPSEINNSRPQSKTSSKSQIPVPFRLPTPNRKSPGTVTSSVRSRATTARSTIQSVQSALVNSSPDPKKPIVDGTIRYVNSRHGFEVQRYSSRNWLSIDVFTKDTCQSHEKTFREMLDKKHQYERLSRSIYSSEYYTKRWHELLQSYKQGYLTHEEWAKQNYQLICLRTLHQQAAKREQRDSELDAQDVRRIRAQSAFNEWKEAKKEEKSQRYNRKNTAHSQRTTEGASLISNNPFSIPMLNTTDENNTTLIDTSLQTSISTGGDGELESISIYQPRTASKNTSASSKALYMLDEQRWSLQAMLKRIVGLAEPLPPPPKATKRKQSPMTNISTDSGFESVS